MKTIFLPLLITVLFMNLTAHAQHKAALHSNGNTTIFSGINPFVDAYTASNSGDTIYLSGGGYVSPTTIDKSLTIFGAGYHPDSTLATYPTFISTTYVYLGENADSLHLEGIEFNTIRTNNNVQIDNLIIKRSKVNSILFSYNAAPSSTSTGFELLESIIINQVSLVGMSNSIISNNIIQGHINSSSNNFLQNNLFLVYNYSSYNINNIYANNIFSNTHGTVLYSSTGNIFENNIFAHPNPNLGTAAIDINNSKNVDLTMVYVNQSGNTFDYAQDYHLQTAAASTYLGNDNTQVGIYGGLFPFKEGSVPLNPHIQLKNIAPQTNNNGDLNIQIKVGAQDQ